MAAMVRGVRTTFLPHALQQMTDREIPEEEVRATLEEPDLEYPGNQGRTVAERVFPCGKLAVKVVHNSGAADERVIVSVMRGRSAPRR